MTEAMLALMGFDECEPLRVYLISEIRKMHDAHLHGGTDPRLHLEVGPKFPPLYDNMKVEGNVVGIHSNAKSDFGEFFMHMDEFLEIVSHPDFQELIVLCKQNGMSLHFDTQWNMYSLVVNTDVLTSAAQPFTNSLMNRNKMGALNTNHLSITLCRSHTEEEIEALKQEAMEVFGARPDQVIIDSEDFFYMKPNPLNDNNKDAPSPE